jgi:ABC transporter substrate binding protein
METAPLSPSHHSVLIGSVEELRATLRALRAADTDAFFEISDAMVTSQTDVVIEAVNAKRLPSMFNHKAAVIKGALASYGESYRALGHLAAKMVQRVLFGADPATLPVEEFDRRNSSSTSRRPRRSGSESRRRCSSERITSSNSRAAFMPVITGNYCFEPV